MNKIYILCLTLILAVVFEAKTSKNRVTLKQKAAPYTIEFKAEDGAEIRGPQKLEFYLP